MKLESCYANFGFSLNPKTSLSRELYVEAHPYNPNTGAVETSRSQSSLASQLSLLVKFPASAEILD